MRFLTLIIFTSLFWSCSSLKIQKASCTDEIKGQSLIYQIPQNKINLRIELAKVSFIPGPYAKYSKTYLEINSEHTAYEKWGISEVRVETEGITDTSQVYLLSGDLDKISAFNLSQISANNNSPFSENIVTNYTEPKSVIPYFSELGLRKIIIEDKKTSYKEVFIDSISKRIPIVNIVVRNKNTEELAKDAAKTLSKIRKRKFRLIAGLNEKMPKETALEFMINELNKKEQYYLELFLGRTEILKSSINRSVVPNVLGKYFLFYLDKENGLHSSKGSKIELNIENQNSSVVVDSTKNINTEQQFPYRKSELVTLSIQSEHKVFYQQNVKLSQFGEIKYLPLKFLLNKEIAIDFKSGEIKGLE